MSAAVAANSDRSNAQRYQELAPAGGVGARTWVGPLLWILITSGGHVPRS